jgi:hypothetical protein
MIKYYYSLQISGFNPYLNLSIYGFNLSTYGFNLFIYGFNLSIYGFVVYAYIMILICSHPNLLIYLLLFLYTRNGSLMSSVIHHAFFSHYLFTRLGLPFHIIFLPNSISYAFVPTLLRKYFIRRGSGSLLDDFIDSI